MENAVDPQARGYLGNLLWRSNSSSAALAVAIDGTSQIPANTFPSIFLDRQVCIPFPGRDWLCAGHPFRPVACAADDIFDETLLQFGFWRQQL